MSDRSVSASHSCAIVLWAAALTLVILGLFTHVHIDALGLLCAGGAVTLNIRGYLAGMEETNRNLFELGRDLGRSEVRSLR